MGRISKISSEVKIKIVEEYLDGKISIINKSTELGVSTTTICKWVQKYKVFGANGLIRNKKNAVYESDIKLKAVKDYLSGSGSTYDICIRYNISSTSVLDRWIKLLKLTDRNATIS